jgi:hypothetical protein
LSIEFRNVASFLVKADVLVRVLNAVIEGLVTRRILTPELCPDEVSTENSYGRRVRAVTLLSRSVAAR